MSLIFSTQTGITCNNVKEMRRLSLPAPRLTWEASDPFTWQHHKLLESGCRLQTIGDLIDAYADPTMAREVDLYNSKADHFGVLLNLAVSMIS